MKVSILICTLNEKKNIAQRLQNIENLFQTHGFEISVHVLDNGSTDQTVEIAKVFAKTSRIAVEVHSLGSIGKCGALFWGFRNINSDLYILTDANTVMASDSIAVFLYHARALANYTVFVGNTRSVASCSAGRKFFDDNQARVPLRMALEEYFGLFSGANGACYAVTSKGVADIWHFPVARNDDFVISTYAASKGRVKWLPDVKAFEVEDMKPSARFRQKHRDALGHFQACRWIVTNIPSRFFGWKCISIRILLWLMPLILFILLIHFFGYHLLAPLTVALMWHRPRDFLTRSAALYVGGISGVIWKPSSSWNTAR